MFRRSNNKLPINISPPLHILVPLPLFTFRESIRENNKEDPFVTHVATINAKAVHARVSQRGKQKKKTGEPGSTINPPHAAFYDCFPVSKR